MEVLSIFGSPHRHGISSSIHDSFLETAAGAGHSLQRVHAYDEHIHPCTACGRCREEPACVFNDRMTSLYGAIRNADVLIISSPVYFSSLPGQLKNLIDRCQVLWEQKKRDANAFRAKYGFLILTAGSDYKNAFDPSFTVIRHFYASIHAAFNKKRCIFLPGVDTIHGLSSAMKDRYKKASERFFTTCRRNGTE